MQHCKRIWNEYFILKMDVTKYFQNIDKEMLMKILKRKIKDKDLLWLTEKLELNSKTQIFKSKQGVNFCEYKINEYRLKIRDKGKRKLKEKVKKLKAEIKKGKTTSKEAKKYLSGHLGYIKIANVKNLTEKIFYTEN